MGRLTAWMLLAAITLGPVGCVAQREVDELRTLYRRSQDQVLDLQAQLEEAEARIAALQAQGSGDADYAAQLQAAMAERDRLRSALDDAEARLRGAKAGPALPAELDAALAQLAAQYPDLMSYDADLGMVKFRSDLTFGLGSAEVQPAARDTLQRLAQVLQSPAAQGYEVRIVGHTDNVRIANPETRAKHPTNWHLSAHRAISVENVLESAGVQPSRMGVAGYGPYRPVVPNGPRGAEANRRVEIYLVAMGSRDLNSAGMGSAIAPEPVDKSGPAGPTQQSRPAEDPALFK